MNSGMFTTEATVTGEEAVAPAGLFGAGFASGQPTTTSPELLYANAVRNDDVSVDADADILAM